MAMAKMAGLVVPDFGLVALPDDRLAYVVRRFDRTNGRSSKRRQEDFCSLTQHDPSQKYHATAEDCAEVVRRYSTEADEDLRRLFRQFLFAFWAGKRDLHLKNLSLAQRGSRGYALSPAYDLVCTRLYPQLKKGMALSLGGVTLHQQRGHFITFAASCGINIEEAHAEIDRMLAMREEIERMIGCSALPRPFQLAYKRELAKRAAPSIAYELRRRHLPHDTIEKVDDGPTGPSSSASPARSRCRGRACRSDRRSSGAAQCRPSAATRIQAVTATPRD